MTPISPHLTFREFTDHDYAKLLEFLQSNNRKEVLNTFNPFPFNDETAQLIARTPKKDKYYACFDKDELVGFSMLRGWDEGYDELSFGIVIGYENHGKGYGKQLLQYTIQQAQAMNCASIRLSVFEDNGPAYHIYKKAGFEAFEKQTILVNNKPRIKYLMRLRLSNE